MAKQWSIQTTLPNVTIDQNGQLSADKIGWEAGTVRLELTDGTLSASKDVTIEPVVPAVGQVSFKQSQLSISVGAAVGIAVQTSLAFVSGDLNDGQLTVTSPKGDKVSAVQAADKTWSVRLDALSDQNESSVEIDLAYDLAGITHNQKLNFEVVLTNDQFSIGGGDTVTAGQNSQYSEQSKGTSTTAATGTGTASTATTDTSSTPASK